MRGKVSKIDLSEQVEKMLTRELKRRSARLDAEIEKLRAELIADGKLPLKSDAEKIVGRGRKR